MNQRLTLSSTSLRLLFNRRVPIVLFPVNSVSSMTKRECHGSRFIYLSLPLTLYSHAALFSPLKGKLLAAEKLKSSGLEYTLVSNGFFMDYYGLPKVKSYLQPFVFAVDIANSTAAIPGSGNVPVAFTHTLDVAKYVAALIGEEKWNERSIIIGDKLTWNDLVSLAETTKGLHIHRSP